MKSKIGWVLWIGVCAVGACAAPESVEGNAEGSGSTGANADVALERVANVEIVRVTTAPFSDYLELVGETDPVRSAFVSSELPGRIEELNLVEGERVESGATVLRVNTATQATQLDQIQTQRELVELEIDRNERLMERGLGNQATLDQLNNQLEQLDDAENSVRVGLRQATTRAPIAGIVVDRMAEPGELASPGVPVARIVDIDTIVVTIGVPEREIARLDEGMNVDVVFPASGEHRSGRVHRIAVEANRANRTFATEIHIENADHSIRAGMRARVQIPRESRSEAILIPRDAMIEGLNGPEVVVADGEFARVRNVVVGPGRAGFVVVDSGLTAGDRLVVRGHRTVVNGERVLVADLGSCCADQIARALGSAEGSGSN